MSQNNKSGWTSEHLLRPNGTALYAAQQRERLRQMANEVLGLLHEYQSALGEIRIDGDKPLEHKVRAFRAARPMASLEKHLRDAVADAGKVDTAYTRLYVELPKKREARAKGKELKKANKGGLQGVQEAQALNTAASLHGIGASVYADQDGNDTGNSLKKGPVPFLDFLQKEA
ncbi:hypothetical protein GCM10009760_53170 [Kitasatospora kazusensis]|uniref:Uncharacterized protein n=1 Tax=Kitasatospora kazusensis TaxID=407974 RepID=A0ABN3A5E0_9ACTN